MGDLSTVVAGSAVATYPLVSSKLPSSPGVYTPSSKPRSKRVLGHHLLSWERAKLRGRGKTEYWDLA